MGLSLSLFSLACNVMFPGDDQAVFQCSCAGAGCNIFLLQCKHRQVTAAWGKQGICVFILPDSEKHREFAKNIEKMFLHREFTSNIRKF